MHQKRFLNIYDEKFSQALNKTPDELDELLKHIGLVIDDRVFSYDGTSWNANLLVKYFKGNDTNFANRIC